MKTAVLVLLVSSALAAPTEEIKTEIIESTRTKKSAYGPPCAGGGAGGPMAPVALYLSTQPAGLGSGPEPHYRGNEHMEETKEMARSYYDAPAAGSGAGSSAGGLSSGGSAGSGAGAGSGAVGVFPSANVGPCAIPLLLSCAPNVVSGHLSHAPAAQAAYPSYKANEIDVERQRHVKDLVKKSSDVHSAASETQEKQSMMEEPELESQTLFHHSRPMGMGFMHSHGMMEFPHHFGHGHF